MRRLPVTLQGMPPPRRSFMFAASRQVRVMVLYGSLAFAEPPLLRLAFEALLFAFQLRGEQYAEFALPRKRRANDTSPYRLDRLNHVFAFQSFSPDAEVDATPVDFHFSPTKVIKIYDTHVCFSIFFEFLSRRPLGRHFCAACSGFVALAALLRLTCQS